MWGGARGQRRREEEQVTGSETGKGPFALGVWGKEEQGVQVKGWEAGIHV